MPNLLSDDVESHYLLVIDKEGEGYVFDLPEGKTPEEAVAGFTDVDDELVVFHSNPFLEDFHRLIREAREEDLGDALVAFLASVVKAAVKGPREQRGK